MSDVGVESLDLESLESSCIRRGRWQIWRVNKEEEEEEEGQERVFLHWSGSGVSVWRG